MWQKNLRTVKKKSRKYKVSQATSVMGGCLRKFRIKIREWKLCRSRLEQIWSKLPASAFIFCCFQVNVACIPVNMLHPWWMDILSKAMWGQTHFAIGWASTNMHISVTYPKKSREYKSMQICSQNLFF
jgi:hypothetical protein